ncbi:unnamed protein product [Closterium sp. NIES-53]
MWQIPVVPMPMERQVAASVSTKGSVVGSGDDANDGIKENESRKCNLGGTSKQCKHKESGEAAKEQQMQLLKEEMVAGIHMKEEPNEVLDCPTCMQANFSRFSFSSSEATAKRPLDEVVMDIVGPLKLGAARAEYFLTIVDVYTHMTWVYVLSKKSDVAETVKTDWLPMVERQQDWLVKAIRTDRGGEALTHVGADKWVPYVEWIGRKPKVDMLRVFGCMCMALVPRHLQHNKLGAKAIWDVHLGMDQNSKGWLLWDPFTKKFLVSRDCKFMEDLMYKDWKAENEAKIGVLFREVKIFDLEHLQLPLEMSSDSAIRRQSSLVNGREEAKNGEQEGGGGSANKQACNDTSISSNECSSDTDAEWKKAMESELKSIEENDTWELVEGHKAITSKWFFEIKSDADCKIERYKSRLVAKGYQQRSFMVVYVDDILIFSPSSYLEKEVMLKLQDKFKCKALGDMSFYLGLHIERDVEKRCMRVHQRKYLYALAANFGQIEGHVATPFAFGFKCEKGPEEEIVDEEERRCFHSLVGSLIYAAVNTRPDVAFATG